MGKKGFIFKIYFKIWKLKAKNQFSNAKGLCYITELILGISQAGAKLLEIS